MRSVNEANTNQGPQADQDRQPNPDAIAWYVEQAQTLLEDQQRRGESLRVRGGQLAAFAGAVLALVGTNAQDMMAAADGGAHTVIGVSILVGAVLLVAAVVVAVLGGFRPRLFSAISAKEIGNYLTDRFTHEPELWRVHIRTIRGLKSATETAQSRGEESANALNAAVRLFLAGLLATFVAIATLVIDLL